MTHRYCKTGPAAILIAALLLPTAAVPAEEEGKKDDVKVGYDKGFYIKTEKFLLSLGARVQFRFTQSDLDGAAADKDSKGSFSIPRARIIASGYFYQPTVKYYIQYDLHGENTATGLSVTDPDGSGPLPPSEVKFTTRREPDLRDAYLDLAKYPLTQLRVGQFKVPFGTQELTSSGSQQFVDRSVASEEFAPSRDQGTMLFGHTKDRRFGYMAGVSNGGPVGKTRNLAANDNEKYRTSVRFNFDPNGEYKLEESAVDHPEKVNWTIGGAWTTSANDAAGEEDEATLNAFFGLKYRPVSVLAEWYDRTLEPAGGDLDSDGFIFQAGLFVVPKKVEVAVRRSEVDPDKDVDDDEVEETRLGLNFFHLKHNYKLQLDYGVITRNEVNPEILAQIAAGDRPGLTAGDKADDKEFRAQLQFRF